MLTGKFGYDLGLNIILKMRYDEKLSKCDPS